MCHLCYTLWYFSIQSLFSTGVSKNYLCKGDLSPNFHSCFYDICLLILWRKNPIQSLVVFWSVLTKIENCKVWIRCKWHHTCECTKHVTPSFLLIFLFLWRMNFLQNLAVFLAIFEELTHLWSFEWLNCVSMLLTSTPENIH